ncbi:hypothetical protein STRTUCAR8_02347, partial [Streptomyces turgidiscabies Car8]
MRCGNARRAPEPAGNRPRRLRSPRENGERRPRDLV